MRYRRRHGLSPRVYLRPWVNGLTSNVVYLLPDPEEQTTEVDMPMLNSVASRCCAECKQELHPILVNAGEPLCNRCRIDLRDGKRLPRKVA